MKVKASSSYDKNLMTSLIWYLQTNKHFLPQEISEGESLLGANDGCFLNM